MRKKNQSGFTLIELLVVIAIIAILASLAIPRYMGKTLVLARTYPANQSTIVMEALSQSFSDLNIPIQVIDGGRGYIETAWLEYLGEDEHGILKIKWKERKKYSIELKRDFSANRISLQIEVEIQEKPSNSSNWVKKKEIPNPFSLPEIRDLNKKFETHYLELNKQKGKGA